MSLTSLLVGSPREKRELCRATALQRGLSLRPAFHTRQVLRPRSGGQRSWPAEGASTGWSSRATSRAVPSRRTRSGTRPGVAARSRKSSRCASSCLSGIQSGFAHWRAPRRSQPPRDQCTAVLRASSSPADFSVKRADPVGGEAVAFCTKEPSVPLDRGVRGGFLGDTAACSV